MSTVLVTGAHGFIGRHTARHFAARGWTVVGAGHGDWPEEESAGWGLAQWHRGDLTLETLARCSPTPEAIVHCAGSGSVGFSLQHPLQDYRRNVETLMQALEYARRHAPQARITLLSSGGVYGDAGQEPIVESTPPNPISPYGVHKLVAEQLCRSYARHFSLRLAIVRLFSVYGPGLRKQLPWDTCVKASSGGNGFFGSGEEVRDWLHVQDAAALIYVATLAATPACEAINGAAGAGVTVREIVSKIFSYLGRRDAPTFTNQPRAGDPERYIADIGRARKLGWEPRIALRDGLREYVDWFTRNRA